MRHAVQFALAFVLFTASSAGAAEDQDGLVHRRDEKLAGEWLKKAPWILDYDKALADSKAGNRPVFAFLTRSYAPCGYCEQFEKGVLSDAAFPSWAGGYVLLCHVTSRVEGESHPDLLSELGGTGFPYLVFLDADGSVLVRHKGARTLEALKVSGEKARGLMDLRRKAQAGDRDAGFEILLSKLEMGAVQPEALKAKLAVFGELSAGQKARLEPVVVTNEVRLVLASVNGQDQGSLLAAGREFAAMKAAGRIPQGDGEAGVFWDLILLHAARQKDAALYEEGLDILKARFGAIPQHAKHLADCQAILDGLKAVP